ncbi:hypothetical protein JST56_01860 [Candidatus Dependentiae bacterium]|jgi:hypothetical protein|nr:hypothetical protein [Candidatus Dependentiae bacterium]
MHCVIKFILFMFLISYTSLTMAMFERENGFWTNQDDEAKIDFFGKLTDPKSQRENWYKVSPYVAEFLCTISNTGFIYAGIQNNSPELILAGIASILSHSIPKEWLLYVDKLGVALVISKVVREYQVVIDNPILLTPLALAGLINAADAYLARKKGWTLPHVAWHLSAAALAHYFLQYVEES